MSKKRIVLVIPYLHAGGMERVMSELANQFINYTNTEIHLVLYGKKSDVFYKISESVIFHKPLFSFERVHPKARNSIE